MGAHVAQVAYNPKTLAVYSRLNGACDIIVQDASSFCAEGERLSFAELQLRAQAVDQARALRALLAAPLSRACVCPL